MHLAVSADSPVRDVPSRGAAASHRVKFMVAGVAVASAGALAVNPVVATPAMPTLTDIRSAAAVELSAFENPLEVLAATISKTVGLTAGLGGDVIQASGQVLRGLGNPALHAEFAAFVRSTLSNPLVIAGEVVRAPFEYGGRLLAAVQDLVGANLAALAHLPGVLQKSLTFVSQGRFLEAYGEINTWFLVDVLGDGRATLLDAFAIPGDFADAIGAHALARVFDSVLNRNTVGNLGRALLGPLVTAIIQTTEILDATRGALASGDLAGVASALLNAPAKIANAFINGYVPEFTVDPQWPPQVFPGLLSERGTLDFFLVQIPKAIAAALAPPAPAVAPLALAADEVTVPSVTSTSFGSDNNAVTLAVVGDEDESTADDADVVAEVPAEDTAAEVPAEDVVVEAPATEDGDTGAVDEDTAGDTADEDTADDDTADDAFAGEDGDFDDAKTEPRKIRGDKTAGNGAGSDADTDSGDADSDDGAAKPGKTRSATSGSDSADSTAGAGSSDSGSTGGDSSGDSD
ncbi:hypothetical protein [Mycolicibacterium diernhoferi]|uniref:hypothetical protein n=2 Tax=Mycolicibacterium diernhoferi TaxID=1801 RepID=UPI0010423E4B|nr:hypothetical protein [Mycolicibacterium diernhoferi]QYL21851.1 hypothetical protein K0O62_23145 [Mycolicibacterium diernhoferi]